MFAEQRYQCVEGSKAKTSNTIYSIRRFKCRIRSYRVYYCYYISFSLSNDYESKIAHRLVYLDPYSLG